MPSKSLLWRAVVENMFNVAGVDTDNRNVGRIAAKCSTFVQYVRKIEQKLSVNFSLSDEQMSEIIENNEKLHWKRLVCFYQFRALFALLIESIILTDRLLFVKEQGYENSFLLKLFDSNVSPRCYSLVVGK